MGFSFLTAISRAVSFMRLKALLYVLHNIERRISTTFSVLVLAYRLRSMINSETREMSPMYTVKRILVATDFSEYSAAALDYALSLAAVHQATVHLLHVVDVHRYFRERHHTDTESISEREIAGHEEMKKFVYTHVDELNFVVQDIRRGVPHEEIIRYAVEHTVDLIVMATHGRTGVAHTFIGSVAEKVVRYSPIAVLTVKPNAMQEKILTVEDVEQNLHICPE